MKHASYTTRKQNDAGVYEVNERDNEVSIAIAGKTDETNTEQLFLHVN